MSNTDIKNGLVIDGKGNKEWYKNDVLHREDGPAREKQNGIKEWYINGQRHRDNDLPAVEYASGTKQWWVNGKRHRENGPAVEWINDDKYWYIHGQQLSEAQFNHYVEMKRLNKELQQDLQINNTIKTKIPKI